jgi:hypothetical protein
LIQAAGKPPTVREKYSLADKFCAVQLCDNVPCDVVPFVIMSQHGMEAEVGGGMREMRTRVDPEGPGSEWGSEAVCEVQEPPVERGAAVPNQEVREAVWI